MGNTITTSDTIEVVLPKEYAQTKGQNWSGYREINCRYDPSCGGDIDLGHRNCVPSPAKFRRCVNANDAKKKCKDLGTWDETKTVLDNNDYNSGVRVSCTYTSIKPELIWNDNELDKYFDQDVKQRIQRDACKDYDITQLSSNESNCKRALGDTEYLSTIINKCEKRSDWYTNGACLDSVTSVVRNDTPILAGKAKTMITKYCRGGDGSNVQGMGPGRSSTLCACLNASDFGFAIDPTRNRNSSCYDDDKKNLPGCDQIILKTAPFMSKSKDITPATMSVVQASISDVGLITNWCTVDARTACDSSNTEGCVFPLKSNATRDERNFNICNPDVKQGAAKNSPVSIACKFYGSETESGTGPVKIGGDDNEKPPIVKEESFFSKNKWFIGGGICILLLFIIFIIFLI